MKVQSQIPVKAYTAAGFMQKYQKLVRDTVIPYQYSVLWDRAPDTEKSHVAANFINAAKALRGEDVGDGFYGMVFQDSDAAKWLEAAAYALMAERDEKLEAEADELIALVAAAQDTDGYLDTYFTIKDKDKRWTNLLEAHELYCAGHMIEAACAYFEATGKRKLLDAAIKNAECIYRRFVTEGAPGCPGHPEVELALLKLYRLTGDERFLRLSERFIDERGVDPAFYEKEAKKRSWSVWNSDPWDNDYRQSSKPVRQQSEAVGHAVRAVYLYTAMADLASETGDKALLAACRRLWEDIVQKKMYITGGIGSTVQGEAFTVAYDLPPDTAYSETCAAIGLLFFGSRMLENEVKGEYADVMELAFYNTVLAGMQLDGKRFFYVNPLEVVPGISGKAATQTHDLPQRPPWYACACCPPNVARLLSSIGSYAYGEGQGVFYTHLYLGGTVQSAQGFSLECHTDYPRQGTAKFTFHGEKETTLAFHIPAWSQKTSLSVNGEEQELAALLRDGYAYLTRSFQEGDVIELSFDMTPYKVYASSKVPADTGCAAVQRGPVVYCAEGLDNGGDVLSLSLAAEGAVTQLPYEPELLGGIIPLAAEGWRTQPTQELYSRERPQRQAADIRLVPYYTWGNRGENQMRVWLPET